MQKALVSPVISSRKVNRTESVWFSSDKYTTKLNPQNNGVIQLDMKDMHYIEIQFSEFLSTRLCNQMQEVW